MKKIYFAILSLLFLAGVPACSDLLEEKSHEEIDKNNFVNDAKQAEQVLLGVYRSFTTDACYGYYLSILFNISTDLAQCEGRGTTNFRAIPTNFFNQTTKEVKESWQGLYKAVYNANDFIETLEKKMQKFTDEDKALAHIYLGEAHALRALAYFELVRWWGHVPLMTKTSDSKKEPSEHMQADPKDVYAFIEEDLKFAVEALPWWYDDVRKHPEYRLSKSSAAGLLAKVYATWAGYPVKDASKWELAAKMAEKVITEGQHALLPVYRDLWHNTCNGIWNGKESLIEVSFYAPTYVGSSSPVGRIGKWNGVKGKNKANVNNAGNVKVVYPFMRKWMNHQIALGGTYDNPIDVRYDLSIADFRYDMGEKVSYLKIHKDKEPVSRQEMFEMEDGMPESKDGQDVKFAAQTFTPRKWDTGEYVKDGLVNNDHSNINWYILRYADVLLLYAEAMNEWQGPKPAAIEALNQVRRRGFGKDQLAQDATIDTPASISQDDLRQVIRDERAYELCFEGHRRQDLVRWDTYYETIQKTAEEVWTWLPEGEGQSRGGNYTVAHYTTKGKNELFPIPLVELDRMKHWEQNFGWEF